MRNRIVDCVFSVIIIFNVLFFVVTSMVGYSYTGSDESSLYIIICTFLFFFTLIYLAIVILKDGLFKKELMVLGVLCFFLLSAGVDYLRYFTMTMQYTKMILFFGVFTMTGSFSAIIVSKRSGLFKLVKHLEISMIVITITCCVLLFREGMKTDYLKSFGSLNYQSCAYYLGFASGLNMLLITYKNQFARFDFTRNKIYPIFQWILFLMQIIGCISSGGRGGLVLLVIYAVYFGLVNKEKLLHLKYLLILGVIVLIGIMIIPYITTYLLQFSAFQINFERVFNYSDQARSGIVYPTTLKMISEKPFLGWGIWGYMNTVIGTRWNYPHNILLEVLLQGGVLYFAIFISFIMFCFGKLIKMIKSDSRYQLIAVLLIFPLVNLMFSGSYMVTLLFWFCVVFIYLFDFEKGNRNENKVIE